MNHLPALRGIGLLGAAATLFAASCTSDPAEPTSPPPPAVVVPPEDDVNNPPPPPPPPPVSCTAYPLPSGGTVNCDATFASFDAYCAAVFPAPGVTNLDAVFACGECNEEFLRTPQAPTPGGQCPNQGLGIETDIDDIPEGPPPAPPEPETTTCAGCHAPTGYGDPNSIEDPHPWTTVQCTQCHGGDGTSTNPVYAHVCAPPEIGNRQQQVLDTRAFFLRFTTAGVQLLNDYQCLQSDGTYKTTRAVEWLNFQNPGDLRSAKEGMGCGTCHAGIVETNLKMVMGNAVGLNSGTMHGSGKPNDFAERRQRTAATDWNTLADVASADATNPDYDPNNRVVGEVPSVKRAQVYTGQQFRFNNSYTADVVNNSLELNNLQADNYPNGINNAFATQIFQEVLNQACTGCHLQNKYNNNRAGDYRESGCTACHFQVGTIGRSGSKDPNVKKYEPVNPNFLTPGERSHLYDHRVRNVARLPGQDGLYLAVSGIQDGNCKVCHEGSNRTVAQYEGYRLDQNQDLTNANFYPSNNNVTFTYRSNLFGENAFFNNRALQQWIDTEVWQADTATQDETPEDVHHEAGLGCIDCHGTGSTHGGNKLYSRMKVQSHENDVLCETCHGTIDKYAYNDGQKLIDQAGNPMPMTVVNDAFNGEFFLVSKLNGSLHYIPQVRDIVDATQATGGGKVFPQGHPRAGQPLFSYVGSYAMGRYQASQTLRDGYGPIQPNNAALAAGLRDNFSHGGGAYYTADTTGTGQLTANEKGLECYTCHSAWQNNCIGCHLDANYDNNQANFFYSQVTGERIYFNFAANFVYQNPIDFLMGINDRGRISPYQGLHRFYSYTDLNNNTSNRVSYSDRNGLGNDPQLRNANRNALPALQNQPFMPHSIRARWTSTEKGMRGCLDCHVGNANAIFVTNQANAAFDLTAVYANYANAIAFNVNGAMGLGTNNWLFDANGDAVVDTNNAAAYDLDRLVEAATGVTNSSSNHPLFDPFNTNPDYLQFQDTNNAQVARPLTSQVLTRLDRLNNVYGGLGDVYYYTLDPNADAIYWLNDYNYANQ